MSDFNKEVLQRINENQTDDKLQGLATEFFSYSIDKKYSYNFNWLDRPIIQYPQDIVAFQEIIWKVKPDLIIETGIAHGGSLILSASMLAMLDIAEAIEQGTAYTPAKSKRKVLGIDIDIRAHNKKAIEDHPFSVYIEMIESSSVAPETVQSVTNIAAEYNTVMVSLDSNHTHQHVYDELNAYAHLVSQDSYCIVFDTIIEDLQKEKYPDRPWGPGDNPKTAVFKYLEDHPEFEVDTEIENKIILTVAPHGFLKRVK